MLTQVLQAIETSPTPVSLDDLSKQLGIDRSALDGMIEFWVRKGRLKETGAGCASAQQGCSCSTHPNGCCFSRSGPRTITLTPTGK